MTGVERSTSLSAIHLHLSDLSRETVVMGGIFFRIEGVVTHIFLMFQLPQRVTTSHRSLNIRSGLLSTHYRQSVSIQYGLKLTNHGNLYCGTRNLDTQFC